MGLIHAVVCRTICSSSLYSNRAGPGSQVLDTYFLSVTLMIYSGLARISKLLAAKVSWLHPSHPGRANQHTKTEKLLLIGSMHN